MVPRIAEQGPTSYLVERAPLSATGYVGTRVSSEAPRPPIRIVSEDPITAKPVYQMPIAAGPTADHAPTISAQSGTAPAPAPAVGTVSPQASAQIPPLSSSPATSSSTSWGGLALFAGAVILLWMFAGLSLRRFGL